MLLDILIVFLFIVVLAHLLSLGKTEDFTDMLRSILAQLEYRHQINYWESQGVPFKTHMYVPEVHPLTEEEFHEREDEGHVFKVRI